ncbi:MAG: hypothetical protein WBG18_01170, partial [Xanthobacteraceae bacterium]
ILVCGGGHELPLDWVPKRTYRPISNYCFNPIRRVVRLGAHELRSKRIYNFQKRQLIEIGISGADSPNTVLAHEYCRVRIVHQVASKMR